MSEPVRRRFELRLVRDADLSNESAIIVLLAVVGLTLYVISLRYPVDFERVLIRTWESVRALATSRGTMWFVFACVVAIVVGLSFSAAVRTSNGLSAFPQPRPQNATAAGTLGGLLMDPCNDLDAAGQVVALAGASPFALAIQVLPERMYCDVLLPFARWFLMSFCNSIIRIVNFAVEWFLHLADLAEAMWRGAVKLAEMIWQRLVTPLIRVVKLLVTAVWDAITNVVSFVINLVGDVASFVIRLLVQIVRQVAAFLSAILERIFAVVAAAFDLLIATPWNHLVERSFQLANLLSQFCQRIAQLVQRIF
jgi:hypothetical protein